MKNRYLKNVTTLKINSDLGVGCVYAIIMGWLTGTEPSCDCSSDSGGSCC